MWLLLTTAGLLSVICCLNGYLVYRQQHIKFQSQRPLNLHGTVKRWTESTTGQLLLLSLMLAIWLYAAFDSHMQAHPAVLLPFLVVTSCSMGGFVAYRYLAYVRTHSQDIESAKQKARTLAKSYSLQWYDQWQQHMSSVTNVLVVLVGLASFQQAMRSLSISTQLIITTCLVLPLCSLGGFLAYMQVQQQRPLKHSELIQQNKQKASAGLGILIAFSIGYYGLKSGSSVPVLIACFALPLCCLAGFAMFQYQSYSKAASSKSRSSQNRHLYSDDSPDDADTAFQDASAAQQPHPWSNATYPADLQQPDDARPVFSSAGQQQWRLHPDQAQHNLQSEQQEEEGQQRAEAELQWGPQAPADRPYGDEEGLFVASVPDGEEHFSWPDGSEYFGEWREGQPSGRGIYVSDSGQRHEGEWQGGQEHGPGTAMSPDGSSFYGFWVHGKRHGEGVHKPASLDNNHADIIFLRAYEHGVLMTETVLRMADKDKHRKAIKKEKSRRHPDKKAEPLPKPGEHIFKGHRCYELMRDLQLGIMFSIANANKSRMALTASDVTQEAFGQSVSQYLRSNNGSSFKWKDYSPVVFQRLRQLFGIDNMDYLLSLTGDTALRLLASPGKSGSAFFLSDDDRFFIKTVQQEEMRLLLDLIPRYYRHVEANSGTLLTRFHGLHMVKPFGGAKAKARFVVMGNVFPTDVRLHRKYDLKGSTLGRTSARKAYDPNTVLKDLDVDFKLVLNASTYDRLMDQIEKDCALLEALRVMDYSMLLGVHFLAWGPDEWHPPQIKAQGSGISRAAASAHNPLHWFSGGHTHTYPRTRSGELNDSAPATPSAAFTASSDAGLLSTESSIDDSALRGTPRSSGRAANALDMAALGPAARASLGADLPFGHNTRQHSWTAGKAAPKYRPPPGPSGSLLAARLGHLPRASPALTSLSPLHEDVVSAHNASTPQHALQPHGQPQDSFLPNGQLQSSFPASELQHQQPLGVPSHETQAQSVEMQQIHPAAAHQFVGPVPASLQAGSHPTLCPPLSHAAPSAQTPANHGMVQQGLAPPDGTDDSSGAHAASAGFSPPARPLSPFLEEADLPFNGSSKLRPVSLRPCRADGSPPHDRPHSAGVHFAQNPVFGPLGAPGDGRHSLDGTPPKQGKAAATAKLFRTQSAPLRHHSSHKVVPASPSRHELHEFEQLLRGTNVHMPTHLELLGATSSEEVHEKLHEHAGCRIGQNMATGSMRRLHSKRCTERLGVSIPALAISQDGSSEPEPVLIYFGIIDFLQEYRMKKRMEHVMKATVFGGKTISVVDPHRYAKRFRGFMETLFVRK